MSLPRRKWLIIKDFCFRNKLKVTFVFLAGLASNLLLVLIPVSLGKYFDLTFGFQSHRAAFLDKLPFSFWTDVDSFLIYLTILVALSFVFHFIQRFLSSVLGERFVKELREQLFSQQLKIKSEVYSNKGIGRYLLRHSGDLKSIQNYLTKGVFRFFTDATLIAITFCILYYLDSQIGLTLIVGLLITIVVVYLLNRLLFKASLKRRNLKSGLLSFVNHQLRSIKTVKVFNKNFTEEKKYVRRSEKLYEQGVRFQKIYNLIFTIVPAFFYFNLVLVLFVVHRQKPLSDSIDAENMLTVIFLLITILPVLRRLVRVSSLWELGHISFEKLINVFELEIDENSETSVIFNFRDGRMRFRDLTFTYQSQKPIFENVNFEIYPLRVNHVELGNGEGKSTLVKLISTLFRPQSGVIEVDGQNIHEVNEKSYLKKITFISTEFPLLGRNVFEAISYSRKAKSKEKAQKNLDFFQKDIPSHLKLKLEDKIVDGGDNLSMVQVKLLCIIRAAVTDKPIVVVENPLQHLESNMRKNFLKWIESLEGKKTVVLICKNWKSRTKIKAHKVLFEKSTHSPIGVSR